MFRFQVVAAFINLNIDLEGKKLRNLTNKSVGRAVSIFQRLSVYALNNVIKHDDMRFICYSIYYLKLIYG